MGVLLKIAALAEAGFFRAGRHWPHEGLVVDATDLTEADLERIMADPNLHVQQVDAAAPLQISDEDLATAVKAAIAHLDPADFQKDGKPKLDVLRKMVPDAKDLITTELRDAIWAGLKPAE